jgi:hypothetical protein
MSYWLNQSNMTHPLSPYPRCSDLDPTALTNYSPISYAAIFTAVTLPILYRTKDLLAEKSPPLWFKGSVIYRLRLLYLTI